MRIIDADLQRLSVDLGVASTKVESDAKKVTREKTVDVERDAKRFAPVRSGTLMRSIHHEMSGGGLRGEVGTDLEYARRVEHGFVGADSLGRVYDQAPRAYMGPALDRNAPDYVERIAKIAGDIL